MLPRGVESSRPSVRWRSGRQPSTDTDGDLQVKAAWQMSVDCRQQHQHQNCPPGSREMLTAAHTQ